MGYMAVEHSVIRLVKNGEGKRAHHHQRHEILEHAAAPRDQRRRPGRAIERSRQAKPVLDGHVVLRDGQEARQSRLGCQQVVKRCVGREQVGVIPDGEQLPGCVVEKRKVHVRHERVCLVGDGLQPFGQLRIRQPYLQARLLQRDQVASHVAAVHGADVGRFQHAQFVQVVPIVKVPFVAPEQLEGGESTFEAKRQLRRGDQTEIVRAHGGEQLQPDIRRRRSHRDHRFRLGLKVVRREPVRLRSHETIKKDPMPGGISFRGVTRRRRQRTSDG